MYEMKDLVQGNSYACKFKVTTMLDTTGQPSGLSDTPLQGPGEYESLGVIIIKDNATQLVKVEDTVSHKVFVVTFDDCWEIDDVDWKDPLEE